MLERIGDVRDSVPDVMQAGSALAEEPADRRVGPERTEQLDERLPDGEPHLIDALIVQYVDDHMRSRVAGMRLAVSFGVSSIAVYLLGPAVKAAGFTTLLTGLAVISGCSVLFVALLPGGAPAMSPDRGIR